MKLSVFGASSVGRLRKLNEDAFSYDSSRGDKGSIFLVCDGMGGHKAGEIASHYASIKIVEYFYKSSQRDIKSKLSEAIRIVNREIYNLSQRDSSKRGMGTTVVAAVLYENVLYFANVGDSRAYLLRNDSAIKLTKDHSWLEEKISEGILSPSEARNNPNKNVITKCVGYDSDVEPNFGSIILKEGDRLILCSDGLWDELNDFEMKNIALLDKNLKKSVESLISNAERKGGKDNITVVGVDYGKVRINILNKKKDKILLSVTSVLTIFLLVFSIVVFSFYNNSKTKNNNYQNIFVALIGNINSLIGRIIELSASIEVLEQKNKELIVTNGNLEKKLKDANENSQIGLEENINLRINKIFNLNEYYDKPEVGKFFVFEDKFLFFLSDNDSNRLFFLNQTFQNESKIINFQLPENSENIEADEFIFDNNSDNFYLISRNFIYRSNKGLLFLSDESVNIEKIGELPQILHENGLWKYVIIEDDLYIFNFDNTSKNLEFYNISNSGIEIMPEPLYLDIINSDVSSMDLNFNIQNRKLLILLKNESENYLYVFNKTDMGLEEFNKIPIDSYALPYKILINDNKNNGEVFIYFIDNSLSCYDENLGFLNHYIISEQDKNDKVLKVNDVFVNNGKLFVIDDLNNIYGGIQLTPVTPICSILGVWKTIPEHLVNLMICLEQKMHVGS
ncbi:MAG: Stp1/IreP family PP2C-type Ser/Thr phosphatase, partial [Actinobacteria bacterium]|nr:Stp1/IreP family PP2C-type Ser/Thr phosphatase [Actinomycetota bacterium]